jgi:hypothetical protein
MIKRCLPLVCGLLLTVTFRLPAEPSPTACAEQLQRSYRAVYQLLEDDGDEVGQAIRELSFDSANNLWVLKQHTYAKKFFFQDERIEETRFRVHDAQLFPVEYRYLISNSFQEKTTVEHFDWEHKVAIGQRSDNRRWRKNIKSGVVDPLSVQWALRRRLLQQTTWKANAVIAFTVSKKDSIRVENYTVVGHRQCHTPFGESNCLVIERTSGTRLTRSWHASSLCYLPVRIEQYKKGHLQAVAALTEVRYEQFSGSR